MDDVSGTDSLLPPMELRETQLDCLPVVIHKPDPLPVVIVIPFGFS